MKFMKKNKKGFTLVELMIVVVIMAILVAVAVPIYNAVTDNARKRTCIANQREIVSQINAASMSNSWANFGFTFTITTNGSGDGGTFALTASSGTQGTGAGIASIRAMFSTVPYCPVSGNTITAVCSFTSTGSASIVTSCTDTTHKLVS